jgi:hypothetical protein
MILIRWEDWDTMEEGGSFKYFDGRWLDDDDCDTLVFGIAIVDMREKGV